MNKIYILLAFFASVILYIITPIKYDHSFCLICFAIYILIAVLIVLDDIKRIGFLNFNILFLLSYFACTYVYPIFLVNNESVIGEIISDTLSSTNTINKSVSLSTLAISSYGLAYSLIRKKNGIYITKLEETKSLIIYKRSKMLTKVVCLCMLMLAIVFINTSHEVNAEVNESPLFQEIFDSIIPIFLVCSAVCIIRKSLSKKSFEIYVKKNRVVLASLIILVLAFMLIGDRAPIISIIVMLISTIYLFVKKINPTKLIAIGILGIILMFAISETRQGTSSLRSGGGAAFVEKTQSSMTGSSSAWDILSDLVGEVRELNEGIHYVEHKGLLYPEANAILLIAAPIPYFPSLLVKTFFGYDLKMIKPGPVLGSYNNVGGNHCVVDVYMPFGIIGVLSIFSLFGFLVAKMSNGLGDNLFCKVFYIYLMGLSIFAVRNSLTSFYRPLVFVYIFYRILSYVKMNVKRC